MIYVPHDYKATTEHQKALVRDMIRNGKARVVANDNDAWLVEKIKPIDLDDGSPVR